MYKVADRPKHDHDSADISSPYNMRNFISDMFSNGNITYEIVVHMFI